MRDEKPNAAGATESSKAASRSRKVRPTTDTRFLWLMTLAAAALMMAADIPNAIVRWKHAAAVAAREGGNKERGYELLAAAYRGRSGHGDYIVQQMEWCLQDRKFEEALALQNRLIEAHGERVKWLENRARIHLRLKRFPDAVADALEVERISQATGEPNRWMSLNELSYARAVAKFDLDDAERDIGTALLGARADLEKQQQAMRSPAAWLGFDGPLKLAQAKSALISILDTRGFILLQQGKLHTALKDMNEGVDGFNALRSTDRTVNKHSAKGFPSFAVFKKIKRNEDESIAVLYYHRSLVLKALGDEDGAQRDFREAQDLLGYPPDESVF